MAANRKKIKIKPKIEIFAGCFQIKTLNQIYNICEC